MRHRVRSRALAATDRGVFIIAREAPEPLWVEPGEFLGQRALGGCDGVVGHGPEHDAVAAIARRIDRAYDRFIPSR